MAMSQHFPIALVSMPWGMITEPCLGLSLLQAKLEAHGIESKIFHANIWLLRWLNFSTYEKLADVWALNDFLFTGILDEDLDEAQLFALSSIAGEMLETEATWRTRFKNRATLIDFILKIRTEIIPAYIDECAKRIVAVRPNLIGLTCLFDQTLPSVALARRIKELLPTVNIILGGYALEGETGRHLLATFPWIDGVHQGDGENAIVPLATASGLGKRWYAVPGLLKRETPCTPRDVASMDSSPTPNFDDYFSSLEELAVLDKIHIENVVLPVETSRGCWWGQKSHCVFCGIDEETLKYRQRAPDNALAMLRNLREKYGNRVFRLVDYILPHSYRSTLIPKLREAENPFRLTCEMKANASYEQVQQMRSAGFEEVQPGIESFDTEVLRQMAKGVTAMQNIVLLKSALQVGLKVHYNLLYGFPNDQPEQYKRQVELLPSLLHLDAPSSHINVLTTRFAPLQSRPEDFGLPPNTLPHYRYNCLFSKKFLDEFGFAASKYCYYFENAYRNSPELYRWYRILDYQAQNWIDRKTSDTPAYLYLNIELRSVLDSRTSVEGATRKIDEVQTCILVHALNEPKLLASLSQDLGYSQREIDVSLEALRNFRLIYEEGRRYFSLPTLLVEFSPLLDTGSYLSGDEACRRSEL